MTNWHDIERSTEPWPWRRMLKAVCFNPEELAQRLTQMTENNLPNTTEEIVDMDELSRQEAEVAESIIENVPEPDTTIIGDVPPPVVEDIIEDCDDEDDDDDVDDEDEDDDE